MTRFRKLSPNVVEQPVRVSWKVRLQRWGLFAGRSVFLFSCLIATAVLFYLSYPKVSFSLASWLMLAPFVWGISKVRSFWGLVGYGWLTGWFCNAVLLTWIYDTCVYGGGMSVAQAWGAWLGLAGLLAVPFAVFAGACHFLKKTEALFPLLAACGWVALEWLHQTIAFYGIGFPWLMLGYTQWNEPHVLYIASYAGVYGLSFLVAFVGISVGWCFGLPELKKGLWQLFWAVLVFISVYEYGNYRLDRLNRQHNHAQSLLNVESALLQPNIDQYKKWTPEYEEEIDNTLQNMGAQLTGKEVYLAVWPESAVPGALTEEKYTELFSRIGNEANAYQLIGSNMFAQDENAYVGAYLLAPQTGELTSYRKQKLVPFGEFVPLKHLLNVFLEDIEVMGALGAFQPGPAGQPLLDAGGVKLGTTVCYESIFPQLWRTQTQQGAQLFVNITNDAWFFNTAAPYQHLAANVLRAVENGRPLLRAANTGISAYIDRFGNIQAQTDLFTREILTTSVPLSVRQESTFYVRWGDWFAWLCAILFFTVWVSAVVFWYE